MFFNANIHCYIFKDTISMTNQWQCPIHPSWCWQFQVFIYYLFIIIYIKVQNQI